MIIKNNENTPKGEYDGFVTHLLIGRSNVGASHVSIQITEVAVGGAQFLHAHEPEQCYYIIEGKGRMTVGEEIQEVKVGDAIYIPSNHRHGIENIGDCPLKYLTANSPAFDEKTEATNWPLGLAQK